MTHLHGARIRILDSNQNCLVRHSQRLFLWYLDVSDDLRRPYLSVNVSSIRDQLGTTLRLIHCEDVSEYKCSKKLRLIATSPTTSKSVLGSACFNCRGLHRIDGRECRARPTNEEASWFSILASRPLSSFRVTSSSLFCITSEVAYMQVAF